MTARIDGIRRSFWLLPAVAMAAGLALGVVLVELDYGLEIDTGLVTFVDLDSARAVLQTIATVTVSVAGLAFSVTVVALQLASQQLSPRVLRTFQGNRLAQAVLAAFVGTFVYALVVLVKLTSEGVPALSVTVAIVLAIASFALFIAFVHDIVISLKPSTLIRRIAADGRDAIRDRWPSGIAEPPLDARSARRAVARRGSNPGVAVAAGAGFVARIDGAALVELGARHDVLVAQRAAIGDYVPTGSVLAYVHGDGADRGDVAAGVRAAFPLEPERSIVGDVGYPIRQLVDVALRALSPSLNDPTTAENAVDAMSDLLVRFARCPVPESVRVDPSGVPRLVTVAPGFDDLVVLGFEQVRVAAGGQPVFERHLRLRLEELTALVEAAGADASELCAQARLLPGLGRRPLAAARHPTDEAPRGSPTPHRTRG